MKGNPSECLNDEFKKLKMFSIRSDLVVVNTFPPTFRVIMSKQDILVDI